MITLTLLTLLITLLYNSYIIIKYKKIPGSLSETAYLFGGNKRYWFTIFCCCISFLLLPCLLQITPINLQIFPFIFGCGMLLAGCSIWFRNGLDRIVHYTWAYIAFAMYICYMILFMGWVWLLCYFIVFGILCIFKYKSYVYWGEMLAIIEIIIFILCCCI